MPSWGGPSLLQCLRRLPAEADVLARVLRADPVADAAARNSLCLEQSRGRRLPSYAVWTAADCEDRHAAANYWLGALGRAQVLALAA